MTEKRTLYGKTNHAIQSRFIEELPDECIEKLYMGKRELTYTKSSYNILDKYTKKYMNSMNREEVAKKMNATNKNENTMAEPEDIKLGSKVYHPKFGVGTVVAMAGSDVTIAFENQGIKKINKEYTTLDLVKE